LGMARAKKKKERPCGERLNNSGGEEAPGEGRKRGYRGKKYMEWPGSTAERRVDL